MTGFVDYTSYTFKAKAKDEATVPTAFSASSAAMNTNPGTDYGTTSENLARSCKGNTIVDDTVGITAVGTAVTSGEETQSTLTEYYGPITITYNLQNNALTTSRVIIKFSEDYDPETGTGTWTAATDNGGDSEGLTGLTTSPTGVEHTFIWNNYDDAGTSELDTSVYFSIQPYDASPSGGDAGPESISDAFALNNRPARITWANADGYTFDKDTTPRFIATIPYIRGGAKGFPAINVYESDGTTLVLEKKSIESIVGWEYEDVPDHWNALTAAGIPSSAIDGTNRMRYTVQAADALTINTDYLINGEMGEIRDEG